MCIFSYFFALGILRLSLGLYGSWLSDYSFQALHLFLGNFRGEEINQIRPLFKGKIVVPLPIFFSSLAPTWFFLTCQKRKKGEKPLGFPFFLSFPWVVF